MRVLVTGSSGHVGGAIAAYLMAQGVEVWALRHVSEITCVPTSQQVQCNIGEEGCVGFLSSAIPACEVIIHAAASQDNNLAAAEMTQINCLGTHHVLQLALQWRAKQFIYLSGVSVCGSPVRLPITEDSLIAPASPYVASKYYGECLTGAARDAGVAATILRVTSPVGPGMQYNRIFSIFVKQALAGMPIQLNGKGTRRQNYVDVRDVAQAVALSLQTNKSGIFNIGAATSLSNRELAEKCIATLQSPSPLNFTGIPDPTDDVIWDVSIEKAQKKLNYTPQYSIENSILGYAQEIQAK